MPLRIIIILYKRHGLEKHITNITNITYDNVLGNIDKGVS